MASETFLASFGLIGLRLIELHGIDPQGFAQQVGIASIELPDARTRLPSTLLDLAFEKASSLIPDPAFALRSAECWHPSNLGTLGYAWLSSGSLRTALKRMARYTRVIGQRMSARCADDEFGLRFIFDHGRGETLVGQAMADYTLALIVDMCRTNFGPALNLESVSLRRPDPKNPKPYEDFFRCPIHFGAAEDGFVLERHIADRPLPTVQPRARHNLRCDSDRAIGRAEHRRPGTSLPGTPAARTDLWRTIRRGTGQGARHEPQDPSAQARRTWIDLQGSAREDPP